MEPLLQPAPQGGSSAGKPFSAGRAWSVPLIRSGLKSLVAVPASPSLRGEGAEILLDQSLTESLVVFAAECRTILPHQHCLGSLIPDTALGLCSGHIVSMRMSGPLDALSPEQVALRRRST